MRSNQTEITKPLLTEFSFYSLTIALFIQIIAVAAIVYLLSHYTENPPVILVVAGFCLLVFLFISHDVIIVYPDKLVLRQASLFHYLFNQKGDAFFFTELKEVSAPSQVLPNVAEAGAIMILAAFFSMFGRRTNHTSSIPLILRLKDATERVWLIDLTTNQRQRIIDAVNGLIRK